MYLEISMDDGRGTRVQEVETLENLAAPRLEHLQVDLLETSQVPTDHNKKREREKEMKGHASRLDYFESSNTKTGRIRKQTFVSQKDLVKYLTF